VSLRREIDTATNLEAYGHVLSSFCAGYRRLFQAEAAISRLNCALFEYRSADPSRPAPGTAYEKVLEHLHRIPYDSYDALNYVTNLSHLVYATTILDTFLTDTTLFLLLLHPGAIGKNQQVKLSEILEAKSTHELLTDAAAEKAREVAYLPFEARVEYLRETFGLHISLDEATAEALRHFPSKRNTAVHDQAIYELRRDENGNVATRRKTCALHPTRVRGEDVEKAASAYRDVARAVAAAVLTQCLKTSKHPALELLERWARRQLPAATE
jgi:hypothetical protein